MHEVVIKFVEITAFNICLPIDKFISVSSKNTSMKEVVTIMRKNRFDVLPVVDENTRIVKGYFNTISRNLWTPETIKYKEIEFSDVVNSSITISSLLQKLVDIEPKCLFLIDNYRIIGMVHPSNFNSKVFSSWLFKQFYEIEDRLGCLILSSVDEEELYGKVLKKLEKHEGIERYRKDMEQGVENRLIEYLYFSDLLNITKWYKLWKQCGFRNAKEFNKLDSLIELRNYVMHPIKKMASEDFSMRKLSEKVVLLENALFQLRNVKR